MTLTEIIKGNPEGSRNDFCYIKLKSMQESKLYYMKFIMLFLNKKLLLMSQADCLKKKVGYCHALSVTTPVTDKDFKIDYLNQVINGYIMSDGYVTQLGSLQVHHTSKQEKFVE